MATIEHHARENRVIPDDAYWICVYANNQWRVELGNLLEESPFHQGLRGSSQTVVMLDKTATALSRLWCVYEIAETLALEQQLAVWTPMGQVGSGPVASGPMVCAIKNVNTARASASEPVDQRQIMNKIAGVSEMIGIKHEEGGDGMTVKVLDDSVQNHEQILCTAYADEFKALDDRVKDGTLSAEVMYRRVLFTNNREYIPDICLRGITLAQLREFGQLIIKENSSWEALTIYDVNNQFLVPTVEEHQCSYVEYVADRPQRPQYIVNFVYSMSFKSFMQGLEWHAEAQDLPDTTSYWAFPFAASPDRPNEFFEGTMKERCSYRILQDLRVEMVLVCDAEMKCATRAWWVSQVHQALRLGRSLDIVDEDGALATSRPFPGQIWQFGNFHAETSFQLVSFNARDIFSSKEGDVEMILEEIETTTGIFNFNRRLRTKAAGPAIREAARNGDSIQLEHILTSGDSIDINGPRTCGTGGISPLHCAASHGHAVCVTFLLAKAADPNYQDLSGATPLHVAALAGHDTITTNLLMAYADPTIECFARETPLEVAKQNPAFFLGVRTEGVIDALREKCTSAATVRGWVDESEEIKRLGIEAAYRAWDTDGDGTLSYDEFRVVLRKLTPSLAPAELDEIVRSADKYDKGRVDYADFVSWIYGRRF